MILNAMFCNSFASLRAFRELRGKIPFSLRVLRGVIPLFFLASYSYAGRPLSTSDANIVDVNKFELEAGYEGEYVKAADPEQSAIVSLKYGVSERFDIGVEVPYCIMPEKGLDRTEFGLKFKLINETPLLPALAFRFENELGSSEYVLKGILMKRISKVRFDLNGGYCATGDVSEKGAALASLGIKYFACERIAFVTELQEKIKNNDANGHVLFGTVVRAFGEFEPDIGVLRLVGKDASNKWGLRCGFTHLF